MPQRDVAATGSLVGVLSFLLGLFLLGVVVGALARLALPGPDPMSIWMTSLIGIGGSILGGMVGNWLFGRPGGFMLAVLAATALVYLVRRSRARA